MRSAPVTETVEKPHDWDKVLAVAYLRTCGQTQKASAKAAGVGRRSVVRWEASPWWPDAVLDAADNWLGTLRVTALASIQRGCSEDPAMALRVGERIIPELAPPVQRSVNTEVTVDDMPWDEMTEDEYSMLDSGVDPIRVKALCEARQRIEAREAMGGDPQS